MRAARLATCLLLAAACAGGDHRGDAPAPARVGALSEIDVSLTEVRAITAAARDATAAMASDASRWEEARRDVSTPFDRARVEGALAAHARRHGLALSQLRLGPTTMPRADFPGAIHPSSPYPIRAQDALLEAPLRFVLAPPAPGRIEAFVRTLPEVSPLVIVKALERGVDEVVVEAAGATFRPFDPSPAYALEMPHRDDLRARAGPTSEQERDFEAACALLEQEVEAANQALSALSEARLRRVRLQAWAAAREKGARRAAGLDLPPPAGPGAR